MSKYEKFEIVKLKRNEIQGTEYNPRKITEAAKKKMKKFIKEVGFLQPICIVNKNTMNIVGGHQRISILDSIYKKDDYEITVSLVELDEKSEIEANIKLNNPSMQGEWDKDKLVDIKLEFPDIDFKENLGFDQLDIDYIFAGRSDIDNLSSMFSDTAVQKEIKSELERAAEIDKLKEAKQKSREKFREENKNGETYQVFNDDYMVTFVFNNNAEKWEFMEKIQKKKAERYLKATILYDIFEQKYKLKGL